MTHDDDDDDDNEADIVKDGEGISVPYTLRDQAMALADDSLKPGDKLRCVDSGRITVVTPTLAAVIRDEAARATLPVETYCRGRLRYQIERGEP